MGEHGRSGGGVLGSDGAELSTPTDGIALGRRREPSFVACSVVDGSGTPRRGGGGVGVIGVGDCNGGDGDGNGGIGARAHLGRAPRENRRGAWCAGAEGSTAFRRVFGRGWQRHATSRWGGCWGDWGWGL